MTEHPKIILLRVTYAPLLKTVLLALWLGVSLGYGTIAYGSNAFVINNGFSNHMVSKFSQYYLDPDHSVQFSNLADVERHQWNSIEKDVLTFGYSTDRLWLKSEFLNSSMHNKKLLLEITYPVLDTIEAYVVQNDNVVERFQMGDAQKYSQRPVDFRNFLVPFTLQAQTNTIIYLKIETEGALQAPLRLWDAKHFYENQQQSLILEGLYFGIAFVMVVYNLFIYISIRHPSYLFYSASVISVSLFLGSIRGLGFQFVWPNLPYLNSFILPASICLFGISAILFAISLLHIKQEAPYLYRLKMAFMFAFIALLVACFILPYAQVIRLCGIVGLSSATLSLYTGVHMFFKKQRAARFYILAWTSLLGSFLILGMSKFKLIPTNYIIENSVQVGSAIEIILLSFALADRINEERRKKQKAQKIAIKNEQLAIQEQERYLQLTYQADVDEVKSRQKIIEAEAESKAKTEFLATMSHEIRTPMNGVLGMADLLQETTLSNQQRQYVDVIASSGKSLLNVINDILDYSKISAEKMQIEHIDFDLDQLCLECASIFSVTAERKKLELICSIEPGTLNLIKSDPTRVRQIVINLLGNAFKFTNNGHISLRVYEIPSVENGKGNEKENHTIRFDISDTGIGIADDVKRNLFDAFTQADNSVSRQYGGTGLGLSISKHLTELLGGDIGVESEEGKGSNFWFTIQCQPASDDFARDRLVPLSNLLNRKILIVDDSPEFTQVLKEQADSWGMRSDVAYYGQQAIDMLRQASKNHDPFEVITLDMNMPGMTGIECAEKIYHDQNIDAAMCLLLTAVRSVPDRPELQRAGIKLAMQKPTSARSLRQTLIGLITGQESIDSYAHSADTPQFENRNILVVEDNKVNQMVITGMLKKFGIQFSVANNGNEAMDLLTAPNHNFDLVLMDCEMPVMDGYAATKALRIYEHEQKTQRTPIIALTAHIMLEHQEQAKAVGMDAHISKPINFSDLKEKLVEYLTYESEQKQKKSAI